MLIKDILTENDGITYCPGRIALLGGILAFITLAVFAVIFKGQAFDAMSFGTGYGALTGGGLTGIWAKSKTDKD